MSHLNQASDVLSPGRLENQSERRRFSKRNLSFNVDKGTNGLSFSHWYRSGRKRNSFSKIYFYSERMRKGNKDEKSPLAVKVSLKYNCACSDGVHSVNVSGFMSVNAKTSWEGIRIKILGSFESFSRKKSHRIEGERGNCKDSQGSDPYPLKEWRWVLRGLLKFITFCWIIDSDARNFCQFFLLETDDAWRLVMPDGPEMARSIQNQQKWVNDERSSWSHFG